MEQYFLLKNIKDYQTVSMFTKFGNNQIIAEIMLMNSNYMLCKFNNDHKLFEKYTKAVIAIWENYTIAYFQLSELYYQLLKMV